MLSHLRHIKVLFSVLFSFFVLISSVGISIDAHFCQDEIKSIGILQQADVCCVDEGSANTPTCLDYSICQKSCCQNINQFLKSNYEFAGQNFVTFLNTGIKTNTPTYIVATSFKEKTTSNFNSLAPSLSSRDILYKKQSWLI